MLHQVGVSFVLEWLFRGGGISLYTDRLTRKLHTRLRSLEFEGKCSQRTVEDIGATSHDALGGTSPAFVWKITAAVNFRYKN